MNRVMYISKTPISEDRLTMFFDSLYKNGYLGFHTREINELHPSFTTLHVSPLPSDSIYTEIQNFNNRHKNDINFDRLTMRFTNNDDEVAMTNVQTYETTGGYSYIICSEKLLGLFLFATETPNLFELKHKILELIIGKQLIFNETVECARHNKLDLLTVQRIVDNFIDINHVIHTDEDMTDFHIDHLLSQDIQLLTEYYRKGFQYGCIFEIGGFL